MSCSNALPSLWQSHDPLDDGVELIHELKSESARLGLVILRRFGQLRAGNREEAIPHAIARRISEAAVGPSKASISPRSNASSRRSASRPQASIRSGSSQSRVWSNRSASKARSAAVNASASRSTVAASILQRMLHHRSPLIKLDSRTSPITRRRRAIVHFENARLRRSGALDGSAGLSSRKFKAPLLRNAQCRHPLRPSTRRVEFLPHDSGSRSSVAGSRSAPDSCLQILDPRFLDPSCSHDASRRHQNSMACCLERKCSSQSASHCDRRHSQTCFPTMCSE